MVCISVLFTIQEVVSTFQFKSVCIKLTSLVVSSYGAMWGYSISAIMHLSYISPAKLPENLSLPYTKHNCLSLMAYFDLALQFCLVLSAETRVKFLPSAVIHPSSEDRSNLKVE